MGTATTVPVILSTRYARNISYPYGDSNNPRILRVHLKVEAFLTPMGTATVSREILLDRLQETFHTPMGTATSR